MTFKLKMRIPELPRHELPRHELPRPELPCPSGQGEKNK